MVCWTVPSFGFGDLNTLTLGDSTYVQLSDLELHDEGNTLMAEEFWVEAERVWDAALSRRPDDRTLKFKRGICLHELGSNWPECKRMFDEVVEGELVLNYQPYDAVFTNPPLESWLYLASAEHRLLQFDSAQHHVQTFLQKAGDKHPYREFSEKLQEEIEFARAQMGQPGGWVIEPMLLNSNADERSLALSWDGRTLFFSSSRPRKDKEKDRTWAIDTQKPCFDVYQSTVKDDGTWSMPECLKLGLTHHAIVSGSDVRGESIFVVDNDGVDLNLSASSQGKKSWTNAQPLNHPFTEGMKGEGAMFPNGDRIIMSVASKSGRHDFDLYQSRKKKSGQWTRWKRIGQNVNTWGDERSPFISADGKTLFFVSDGRSGMGGFDVYTSTLLDKNKWSDPVNVGWPINSVGNEWSFALSVDNTTAFVTSQRNVETGIYDMFQARAVGDKSWSQPYVIVHVDADEFRDANDISSLLVIDSLGQETRVMKSKVSDVYSLLLPVESRHEVFVEGRSKTADIHCQVHVLDVALPTTLDVPFDELFGLNDEAKVAGDSVFTYIIPQSMRPDALGVPGGDCLADADSDGVCDDEDPCVGQLDSCEVCNGPGDIYECGCTDIPVGDCDCEGNQLDALGICGGECEIDADSDGICDNLDECVGEFDACGVCNGPGKIYECGCSDVPEGDCDCEGRKFDAIGECGGGCLFDVDGDRICDPPTPILGIEPYIYELPGSNIAIGEGDRPGLAFAVQLKEAQIHTDAVIKLASLVQAVVNARSERRVVIIIEGSAHPRERKVSGGKSASEVANLRLGNIWIRLTEALEREGLIDGKDFRLDIDLDRDVRVQPDERTPAEFSGDSWAPANYRYVRVNLYYDSRK